jgi:O-antigen ligase
MNAADMIVATALFWVFAVLSVSLPPRYGVIAFIVLVQFDLTGLAFYADSSLGWENAVKTIVIPTILLLRIRPFDLLPPALGRARNFWLVLVAYAAISIAWTPYLLSGVKMMGYFYAYSVLFVVFTHAWRRQWITRPALITIVCLSLAFAIVQTYLLGNGYGDPEYDNRFTTFSSAQSFAPFLISMTILMLLCVKRSMSTWLTAAAAVAGFLLTGSRSYFIGFAWVALVIGLALGKRFRHKLSFGLIIKSVVACALVVALLVVIVANLLPHSRINELFDVATTQDNSIQDVTTFAWRLTIWTKTIQEIGNRSIRGVLTGSGTSSAAAVAMETGYFQEANVDPNRCVHDEFLRTLYEWGVIGLIAFLGFLASLFRLSFKLAKLTQAPQAWACLAICVPLLIGLLIENIFADGASPGGVGYCLVFASMAAQLRPAVAKAKLAAARIAQTDDSNGLIQGTA